MIEQIYNHPLWIELNQKYKIAVISPASYPYCSLEQIHSIPNINLFNMDSLLNQDAHPFHSNDDKRRLKALNEALYSDEENLIIWCINGGYGSSKLIQYLDEQQKPRVEKIFIGYSDITALHLFFSQKWNWATIHGACLGELFKKNKDVNNFLQLFNLILKKSNEFRIHDLRPLNDAASSIKDKFAKNLGGYRWTGGNLAMVQSGLATSWEVDAQGKVLFLEDIKEEGYKVDRMLHHLLAAKKLHGVEAVVFGDFSDGDEHVGYAVNAFAKMCAQVPMFKTSYIGHGAHNLPIIYTPRK